MGIILFIVIEITYIDWDIILIILNFRLLTSLLILILVHGLSLLTLGKFAALRVTRVVRRDEDINHLLEFEYKIYKEIESE